MTDPIRALAQAMAPDADPTARRWRTGVVQSVDGATGTCVVIPATGVDADDAITCRYLCPAPPMPGSTVWLVTDGRDAFVLGALAPNNVPPTVSVWRNSDQSVPNSTSTDISFTTAHDDPWDMWTSGTDVTIPVTGKYRLEIHGVWAAVNTTGYRQFSIIAPGVQLVAVRDLAPAAGTPGYYTASTERVLNAGDVINFRAFQTSGVACNVNTNSDNQSPRLDVTWVGHTP